MLGHPFGAVKTVGFMHHGFDAECLVPSTTLFYKLQACCHNSQACAADLLEHCAKSLLYMVQHIVKHVIAALLKHIKACNAKGHTQGILIQLLY